MSNVIASRVKLGFFVVVGAILLTYLVFRLGTQQRLFGSRTKIIGIFNNVSGIREGTDVRFSGVNIGAVKKIEIMSDSAIKVVMIVESDAAEYIKKDSYARINTEGLIGSKFVGITSGSESAPVITDGGLIATQSNVQLDEVLARLEKTSKSTEALTENLNQITANIKEGEGPLGTLIYDNAIAGQIHTITHSFAETGKKTNRIVSNLQDVPEKIDVLANKLNNAGDSLTVAAGNAVEASENAQAFTEKLNNGESTLGRLLTDTVMADKIDETIGNIDETAADVKKTSKKVRSNLFIRLFSKKNKDKEEEEEDKG
jgi:phospholipid/cholesterol/gamma-HCH transport system substrate-binding protein